MECRVVAFTGNDGFIPSNKSSCTLLRHYRWFILLERAEIVEVEWIMGDRVARREDEGRRTKGA